MKDFLQYFRDNPISIEFETKEDCIKIHQIFEKETTWFPTFGCVSFWKEIGNKWSSSYRCTNTKFLYRTEPYINLSAREFFELIGDDFILNI